MGLTPVGVAGSGSSLELGELGTHSVMVDVLVFEWYLEDVVETDHIWYPFVVS